MGGLGHYFEHEGLPTTQISLVRTHTEIIRPPRALWVPFILGRPLGEPGDPEFQLRVLRRVLGLLEESSGPVLVDHDEEATDGVELDGLACPVSYAPVEGDGSLDDRLAAEIASLRTWYDLGLEKTGRTAFGMAGIDIGLICRFFVALAGGEPLVGELAPRDGQSIADRLRFAAEDLRAFVTEAAATQPGQMSAFATKAWFWEQTVAGETLLAAYAAGRAHDDEIVQLVIPVIVPKEFR